MSYLDKKRAIFSITTITIFLFFILMNIYALVVFKQFIWYKILEVGFIFLILWLLLLKILFKKIFIYKVVVSKKNILYSIILLILTLLVSSTSSMFITYFHTFPLLDTELGLGWHRDSAYHVSIIQSILHFGYPSIGLDGVPITIYHVLSHYVDALILYIVNVEPYDSYGLFYHFKVFLVMSSILYFIAYISKQEKTYIYILLFITVSPLIVGTWHIIGSHALWFTSILLILSSIKIFKILIKSKNNLKDFVFLFVIVVVITLGKVSTGFMLGVFIGFFLLLKDFKNFYVYIYGFILIIFFYTYQNLFIVESISYKINLIMGLKYLFMMKAYSGKFLSSLYVCMLIAIMVFAIFKYKKQNLLMLLSSLLTFSVLIIIISIFYYSGSNSDILYFEYGFFSILILLILLNLFNNINNNKLKSFFKHRIFYGKLSFLFYFICIIIFLQAFRLNIINIIPTSLNLIKNNPFFNKKLELYKDNYNSSKRILLDLRKKINKKLNFQNILKKECLMYIPKEVYYKYLSRYKGRKWARGYLIYSIYGIPLYKGVENITEKGYGLENYTEESLLLNNQEFKKKNIHKICKDYGINYIIKVNSFDKSNFNMYNCKILKGDILTDENI